MAMNKTLSLKQFWVQKIHLAMDILISDHADVLIVALDLRDLIIAQKNRFSAVFFELIPVWKSLTCQVLVLYTK